LGSNNRSYLFLKTGGINGPVPAKFTAKPRKNPGIRPGKYPGFPAQAVLKKKIPQREWPDKFNTLIWSE
jgi:hypothetical protein